MKTAVTTLISILIATNAFAEQKRVVCFGDSVTQGYGVSNSWCDQLDALPNIKAINLGVGGNSSRDGVGRFADVIKAKPQIVIIMFGLGDAHDPEGDGARITLTEYESNLDWMIKKLKKRKIKVILQTSNCTTERDYNARLKPYIEAARRLARNHKLALIDNYSAFAEAQIEAIPVYLDYAHPNELGNSEIFRRVSRLFRTRGK